MAAIVSQRASEDVGGVWEGVSSIQGHLTSIEGTFVVLSMSDKQKALQLIITFLQKLKISTYDMPSRQTSVEDVGQRQLASSRTREPLSRTSRDTRSQINPEVAVDARPTSDPQQYLMYPNDLKTWEDQSHVSATGPANTPSTSTSLSSQPLSTSISRREKAAHLNSDFVWGEECDESSDNEPVSDVAPEIPRVKSSKRESRTSNRLKGRRKAKKGTSPDKEGEEEIQIVDRGLVDAFRICDERSAEELDAAVVLDQIIDCIENGLQYEGMGCREVCNDHKYDLI